MKNKYDQIMEHIQMTEEMKFRIMDNINHWNDNKKPSKLIFFPVYKKYLSVAACLIILVAGSLIAHNKINDLVEPPLQVSPDIREFNTIDKLSKVMGFSIKEIKTLPFEAEEVQYTSYGNDLAQIEYMGLDNSLTYRISKGSEDNSGDYNDYSVGKKVKISGEEITLKGNETQCFLATWQSAGYFYSVQLTNGVSWQEMLSTIESIILP